MSIQLQPQKNFAIVRQLPDPSDSGTYYVQAVIRNAETDDLIATINLEDKGDRRFIGIWRAIADKSGQGTLISIRTSVYTDSGYTTLSEAYSQEMETYLILERFNPNEIVRALGPAIGGDDIDYKTIKKIIEDVLSNKLSNINDVLSKIDSKEVKDIIPEVKYLFKTLEDNIIESLPEVKDYTRDIKSISTSLSKLDGSLTDVDKKLVDQGANIIDIKDQKEIDLVKMNDLEKSLTNVNTTLETKNFQEIENKLEDVKSMLDINNFTDINSKISVFTKTMEEFKKIISSLYSGKSEESKAPIKKDYKVRARELLGRI